MIPPPPTSTLFPYTTLFRSIRPHLPAVVAELHGLPPFLGLPHPRGDPRRVHAPDRKSTRLNSSHVRISYAVFCLKKKKDYSPTFNSAATTVPLTLCLCRFLT